MGLTEEYKEDIKDIESSVEGVVSRKDASRMKTFLDQILPFALLSLTFVVLFGFFIPIPDKAAIYINYLNWALIAYFASRLAVEFRLSKHRERFVQNHILDFLLVIPAFSVIKEIKVLDVFAEMELFDEETMISAAFVKEAGIATQVSRITRIIKRSF